MKEKPLLIVDFSTVESRALAMQLADMAHGRVELMNVPTDIVMSPEQHQLLTRGVTDLKLSKPPEYTSTNRHARRRAAKLSKKHGI